MEMPLKTCRSCGKPVRGRSDKKFCDDYCRNAFNNQLKTNNTEYMRRVNAILRRNRNILSRALAQNREIRKTRKEVLMHEGFRFSYVTHVYTNKKGKTYFFCYEFGYRHTEEDGLLIVRQKGALRSPLPGGKL
jgi:predicted nucleic acid-binding Zn ribbon protein